jgi:prepilin-type N-terminal cleavage/methylation domain-containing protein
VVRTSYAYDILNLMKGAQGGFTIIEVMIVLAISGVMLLSAATVFNGRRRNTEFSQAMYDLQSQVQSIANSTSSQAVPGVQQYTCAPTLIGGTMRPALTSGSTTNQDCIYLGQAIQIVAGSSTISSYPIFGLRTVYNGGIDSGDTPTTFADAHPEPAISAAGVTVTPNNPNNLLLINDYPMLNGLQTVSAKYGPTANPASPENDILAFYSSLQDSNTSGNEVTVYATNYSGGLTDQKLQMKSCIEGPGCVTQNSIVSTPWNLCVSDGSRQAQLSIKAIATGIVTSLNLNRCP